MPTLYESRPEDADGHAWTRAGGSQNIAPSDISVAVNETGLANGLKSSPIRLDEARLAALLHNKDVELATMRRNMATQCVEFENLQRHLGSQQARIDYLEGANSAVCVELQATNSHYQALAADLQKVQSMCVLKHFSCNLQRE